MAAPVDDTTVRGIIDHATDLVHRADPTVSGVKEAYQIWQLLIALRRWDDTPATPLSMVEADPDWKRLLDLPATPLDQNLNLMAAEHYGYARFIADTYGDPHTDSVVATYYSAKAAALAIPFGIGEKFLRTSKNHPVLPESAGSKKWASTGVAEGLADYKSSHGGNLGTPGSASGIVTGNAKTQYGSGLGNVY